MTQLSVVIPAFNAEAHIASTIDALSTAVDQSGWHAELIVVDDGSTDGTGAAAKSARRRRLPLRVIRQPNRGRFEARRAGIEAATGEFVLLLDSRVQLHPSSLAFVHERIAEIRVWNGHVDVAVDRNPYGAFWAVVAHLAWPTYMANPRTSTFNAETFERFPKGTGCFLAPRKLLLGAIGAFRSKYVDIRLANDDTPLIRWISEREPIGISPQFSCRYRARSTLHTFIRHSTHRGTVFLDGHGRAESRFYPVVLAFYPISALGAVFALRRPSALPALAIGTAAVAGAAAARARRPIFEIASFAALAPIYAIAHGAGMWRGLVAVARKRLAKRR